MDLLLDNPVLFLDFSCHLIHQQLPVLFLINTDDHLDRVSGDSRQTNERHRNILEDESEQNFGPCCDSCFLGRNRLRSNPEEHFADLDRRPGEEQPERVLLAKDQTYTNRHRLSCFDLTELNLTALRCTE